MEITIKTLDQARETHATIEVNGDPLYTSCQVAHYQSTEAELVSNPLRRRIAELEAELANARAEGQLRVEELEAQLSEFKAKAHAFNLDRKSEAERPNRLNQRNTELEEELGVAVGTLRVRENQVHLLQTQLIREISARKAAEKAREELAVRLQGYDQDRRIERHRADRAENELVRRTQERDEREAARKVLEKERDQYKIQAYAETQRADQNREWAERAESHLTNARSELADAKRAIDTLSGQLGRVSGAVHGPDLQAAMRTTWETKTARAMKEAILQVRDALGSPSLPSSPAEPTSQA